MEDKESSLPLFMKESFSFEGIMLVDELWRRKEPSLFIERNDATWASTCSSASSDMGVLIKIGNSSF